jgi:nucleoside-diphosphate-sugar epimerase
MSEKYRNRHHRSLNGATMNTSLKGTALITGASSGIGAVYADRLARRGRDLIVVARNRDRLDALATRLAEDTGRSVRAIVADLNDEADLARVEQVLHTDPTITMLVNNAGVGSTAPLLDANVDTMVRMIDLNVTALVRLTPRSRRAGHHSVAAGCRRVGRVRGSAAADVAEALAQLSCRALRRASAHRAPALIRIARAGESLPDQRFSRSYDRSQPASRWQTPLAPSGWR